MAITPNESGLFIPAVSADGKNISYKLTPANKEGQLFIPVQSADGKVVAMRVRPVTKEGEIGFPAQTADGKTVLVKSTGIGQFLITFYSNLAGPNSSLGGKPSHGPTLYDVPNREWKPNIYRGTANQSYSTGVALLDAMIGWYQDLERNRWVANIGRDLYTFAELDSNNSYFEYYATESPFFRFNKETGILGIGASLMFKYNRTTEEWEKHSDLSGELVERGFSFNSTKLGEHIYGFKGPTSFVPHRFDGSTWTDISNGQWTNSGTIFYTCEYNGDLLMLGSWTSQAPNDYAVLWDGSSWSGLPGGDPDVQPYSACVHSDGSLYIGGGQEYIGATQTWQLAKYNGSSWENVLGELQRPGGSRGYVYLVAEIPDDGRLLVGGWFETSSKFSGTFYNWAIYDSTEDTFTNIGVEGDSAFAPTPRGWFYGPEGHITFGCQACKIGGVERRGIVQYTGDGFRTYAKIGDHYGLYYSTLIHLPEGSEDEPEEMWYNVIQTAYQVGDDIYYLEDPDYQKNWLATLDGDAGSWGLLNSAEKDVAVKADHNDRVTPFIFNEELYALGDSIYKWNRTAQEWETVQSDYWWHSNGVDQIIADPEDPDATDHFIVHAGGSSGIVSRTSGVIGCAAKVYPDTGTVVDMEFSTPPNSKQKTCSWIAVWGGIKVFGKGWDAYYYDSGAGEWKAMEITPMSWHVVEYEEPGEPIYYEFDYKWQEWAGDIIQISSSQLLMAPSSYFRPHNQVQYFRDSAYYDVTDGPDDVNSLYIGTGDPTSATWEGFDLTDQHGVKIFPMARDVANCPPAGSSPIHDKWVQAVSGGNVWMFGTSDEEIESTYDSYDLVLGYWIYGQYSGANFVRVATIGRCQSAVSKMYIGFYTKGDYGPALTPLSRTEDTGIFLSGIGNAFSNVAGDEVELFPDDSTGVLVYEYDSGWRSAGTIGKITKGGFSNQPLSVLALGDYSPLPPEEE